MNIARRSFLALGAAALTSCRPTIRTSAVGVVACEGERDVALLDVATWQLRGRVPLDALPSTVAAHPNRPLAYVMAPSAGMLFEIDVATGRGRRELRLDTSLDELQIGTGHQISLTERAPATDLWLFSRAKRKLFRVGMQSFRVEQTLDTRPNPVAFHVNDTLHLAAISYGEQGQFEIVEYTSGKRRLVTVDAAVGVIHFQDNGEQILIAQPERKLIAIHRSRDGETVTQLPVALKPRRFCDKADGGRIFASGDGADAVVVVEPYQTQIAATVLAGHAPSLMTASGPPNELLFVANPGTGHVTIVEIGSLQAAGLLSVNGDAWQIAVSPDQQFALVLNRARGEVTAALINGIRRTKFKRVPVLNVVPVGSLPSGLAIVDV